MNRSPINPIRHFVPSPSQFRAARAVLGWTDEATTANAAISIEQLRALEADPRGGEGLFRLEDTYRRAGIEFDRLSGLDGTTDRVSWRKRGPLMPAGVQSTPSAPPENDNPEPAISAKVGS